MDQNIRDQLTADKLRAIAGKHLEAAAELNAAADVLESFALSERDAAELEKAMARIRDIVLKAPA
jgi:hypothetical protein